MNAIKTASLTKYYGKARGIMDLNLTVAEGDFFGFIGPNGAGKSTTIRTLLGLLAPTSGTAEIFGKQIPLHKTELLADIGYMPSEAAFYRNRKVREIINLSADLRGANRRKSCIAEAARLCERLELDTEKRVNELSLGNRKKLSVICALQHNPRLCILDEPTSGLDPLMQREFFAILEERNREGATIFLSSHVLSEVQRHCRHAAVIREGRLLVSDTIEHLGCALTGEGPFSQENMTSNMSLESASAKRVTVRGLEQPPLLKGIRDVKVTGDTMTFLYGGSPKALLLALASLPLTDVTIAEPDLEEIFLHYYTPEANREPSGQNTL
ncbi:MAG: ABC transporter ATP-binding protein [Lachnospiraceae bacterium]|nr:ABC transporter ATP-binding protein [Lachnospiraceae bacterium]